MKLCSVAIDGFRNVKKTKIIFEKMTALISLNSYGKSNLLKAIDFGIDFIKNDAGAKKKMMSWIGGIPLNKKTASNDFQIELELIMSINGESQKIIYGYQFEWIKNNDVGARIVAEWLKAKTDGKKQQYKYLINRGETNAFYRTSITGRCTNKINIEPHNLVVNKLYAFDDLYYSEIVKQINTLNVYVEQHLDAGFSYEPDAIVPIDTDIFELGSRYNLPRIIHHLKEQYPEKYNLLINAYMQLFPQITEFEVEKFSIKTKLAKKIPEDVPFRINSEIYELFVVEQNLNQPISLEDMSDGAKRVFLILTNIVIAEINNLMLIAVEEPENSIHPGLLQKYMRILSQLMGDCQIIITSHSPYILQYQDPRSIYVGLPNEYGIAQFKRIRATAQTMLLNDATDADMSVGEYMFELFSGTEEDVAAISSYLESDDNG